MAFSKATVNLSLLTADLDVQESGKWFSCLFSVSQLCALMVFHKVCVVLSPEALKCCLISRAFWLPPSDSDRTL